MGKYATHYVIFTENQKKREKGHPIGVAIDQHPSSPRRSPVENGWDFVVKGRISKLEEEALNNNTLVSNRRFTIYTYNNIEEVIEDDQRMGGETPQEFIDECVRRGLTKTKGDPELLFWEDIRKDIKQKVNHNKTSVEKKAKEYGINDKTVAKELVESAVVHIAREIANRIDFTRHKNYKAIVDLYRSQVNLSHRTSQSVMLQQYSTPATIGYLMGLYVGINKKGKFYEPSAGNGMLTIASDGSNVDVNEIDNTRNKNLQRSGIYNKVTKKDSSIDPVCDKCYDGILTNPPFGKLDPDEHMDRDGFVIKQLEHKMAILALDAMKDNGKAAIIIGGHQEWDARGRIKAGMNRIFFSYLYSHYNVEDVINIDGRALYSKMGTAFNTRVILINGRKKQPEGFPPLKSQVNAETVSDFEQLYTRFNQHLPQKNTRKMDLLEKAKLLREQQQAMAKGLAAPYIPASEGCMTLAVDTPDSMSYEIHNAVNKVKKAVGGDMVAYVTDKLNYDNEMQTCKHLAAEQIDAVALAIYNIESKGQGIIIGDQTGIGKGRQAASIIRYAKENGFIPVFMTEKDTLFTDLYRDLSDTGSDNYVPFIVNARSKDTTIYDEDGEVLYKAPMKKTQDQIIKSGKLPDDYDLVVLTYSQVNSAKPTAKKSFLASLANQAIFIMDEAHNASGSSNTGEYLKGLVKESVSTIFLSATFAKRPDNMPIYALKTSIMDANMGEEALVNGIENGGVALQEVLASQLVAEGQMIRRERTYEGIEVNYLTLDKQAKQHQDTADRITEIIRNLITFQGVYVTPMIENMDQIAAAEGKQVEMTKGTSQAGVDNTPYFSRVFNVVNQMLFSIKAEEVANRAIMRLKEGKKPVIAFSNTMGSFIADIPVGKEIAADFTEVLHRGLESVMSYTVTDVKGNKSKAYLSPSDLEPEGQTAYWTLYDKISEASTGIVVSPIDLITQKLHDAGYTTAEITGRSKEVKLKKKAGNWVGVVKSRTPENKSKAFRLFNNNEIDVLLINRSGSTGVSAHAVTTDKVSRDEVKQRVMIVLQAELDINTEVQKRGRINRTGQVIKPIYDYLSSAIPAETRLSMMLQKKLKSLDANTTSNQKNSEDLMKSDDFLNKYGDEVVYSWLLENPNMMQLLGVFAEEGGKPKPNFAHKVSGRVAVLPVKEQKLFYTTMVKQYQDMVKMLLDRGDYDLEVESINLEAETINKRVAVVGKNADSLFGGNTYLEECMVNNLRKPMPWSEVKSKIDENLDGRDPEIYTNELVDAYKNYYQGEMSRVFTEKREKWEKIRANIENEQGYKKAENPEFYKNDRLHEIANSQDAEIAKAQNKIRNMANSIEQWLKFFKIGKAVYAPSTSFADGKTNILGAVINVGFDQKASNPFAPSNIFFQVATTDSRRIIDLKASSMFHSELHGIIGASYFIRDWQQQQMLSGWDDATKESNVNRIKRYIVTGNILQGYGSFKKGKLIDYTLKDGGTKKGIMMPLGFSPRDTREANTVTVPIKLLKTYIAGSSGGANILTNTDITFQRLHGGYATRMYVPASKTKGGRYFLDSDILELVQYNNFEKTGSRMYAEIYDENLQDLLDILQDKHGIAGSIPHNRIDDIPGLKEQIEKSDKVTEEKPKRNNAKVMKLKAKAAMIKQKQALLKLQAS